jgi:chromosome segregation ATPase
LTTRTAIQEIKTFTIRNVDAKPKTLIIETPVRPEFKLIDVKPAETTPTSNRFEVKLGVNATEKFPVKEERIIENSLAISSLTPDVLATYVQNRNLDDAARKKLEPLLALKQQLAANQSDLQRLEKQIQDLIQDQGRLRQNIGSLNQVNGQQQRVQEYAQSLAAQETQLAGLRDRQAELQRRGASLEQQVNRMMESLQF